MLELTHISKTFGAVRVLDDVSLTIPLGSRTAIVGPSGSGKTTLLRLIAGFDAPDSGQIMMQESRYSLTGSLFQPISAALVLYRRKGRCFPIFAWEKTLHRGLRGARRAKRDRVAALMAMVSLDAKLARRWPHEISGGQQQRVALARALAQQTGGDAAG
ncbi:hypothetical protein CWS02_04120 [Enterobacter sp. EA-1]|nr:hypothetical protein CWS02_04120 [Enterobacter sp. EA-1]